MQSNLNFKNLEIAEEDVPSEQITNNCEIKWVREKKNLYNSL